MTSVFSSIVLPARKASIPSIDPVEDRYFTLDSHRLVEEEPDLRVLNNALRALAEIFPDVQPEVFREMLGRISEESRLEVATVLLLKNEAKWIRGRYRRSQKSETKTSGKLRSTPEDLPDEVALRATDVFRNEQYKNAVKQALYDEFKGLSRSAIRAVLAEHNFHYTLSRTELISIVSKSWRFSVTSFLFRRKTPSATQHPFLHWTKSQDDKRKLVPKLIRTSNAELDQELYATLVAPVLAKDKEAQEIVDHALAYQMGEQESVESEEIYDCECCYSSITVDNMAACDDGCHFICFRCISHTVNEAIYGQGWTNSVDVQRGTVRCIAATMGDECHGCLPLEMVQRAVTAKEKGRQTFQKLEDRVASESLLKSRLPLVNCPFCSYAEVDELFLKSNYRWKFRRNWETVFLAIWASFMIYSTRLLPLVLAITSVLFLATYYLPNPLASSLNRLAHKTRGLRFTCRSPTCGKRSCMRCQSLWRDPHACYSSQLTSLQQSLESAMTAAVKRTCPKCNVSFVKSAGCNKLVCVCGYQMCYLCRSEIGKDGYTHFCQHFRASLGPCKECEKCDLYRTENEVVVIKKAREKAESEWWEHEGKGVSKDVVASSQPLLGRNILDWRAWEGWLDEAVERFVIVDTE